MFFSGYMFVFLRTYAVKYWRWYLTGLVTLVLTTYVTAVIPLKMKKAIDIIQSNAIEPIQPTIVSIVVLAIVLMISRTLSRIFIFTPGRFVEFDLRNDVYKHFMVLSKGFYRQQKIGDIMSRCMNDIRNLRLMTAFAFLHIINIILIYGFILYFMARIHVHLTLFILLPIPITLIILRQFVKWMHQYVKKSQENLGSITHFIVESIGSIHLIKSYGAEAAILSAFKEENKRNEAVNIKLAFIRAAMFPFITIVGSIGMLILFFYGGKLVIEKAITLGDFTAFSAYLVLLTSPTVAIAWIINLIQRGQVSLIRIQAILDSKPTISDHSDVNPALSLKKAPKIEIKNLSFQFKGSGPILKDISCVVHPGETLGIFGPTGSGKTVLSRLLARLEEVPPNSLFINDTEIHKWPLREFRKGVSFVSQESFLFSDTISNNIAYYESDSRIYRQDLMEDAASEACFLQDIKQFPNSYETLVGEKGVILSGGQKNRLSFSRALYKPHVILILDDILSAVDHKTESQLMNSIIKGKGKVTTIMVSHRVSALTHCDQILVIENGVIIDQGTHQHLITQEGIYKRTWQYQRLEDRADG